MKKPELTPEDQKMIEELLSGERPMPDSQDFNRRKPITVGTKVHVLGYRENLYGFITQIKKGKVEVRFTHLTGTKKWFKQNIICRFEDRHQHFKPKENVEVIETNSGIADQGVDQGAE